MCIRHVNFTPSFLSLNISNAKHFKWLIKYSFYINTRHKLVDCNWIKNTHTHAHAVCIRTCLYFCMLSAHQLYEQSHGTYSMTFFLQCKRTHWNVFSFASQIKWFDVRFITNVNTIAVITSKKSHFGWHYITPKMHAKYRCWTMCKLHLEWHLLSMLVVRSFRLIFAIPSLNYSWKYYIFHENGWLEFQLALLKFLCAEKKIVTQAILTHREPNVGLISNLNCCNFTLLFDTLLVSHVACIPSPLWDTFSIFAMCSTEPHLHKIFEKLFVFVSFGKFLIW